MTSLLSEPAVIHRAGEPSLDRYGDPIPGSGGSIDTDAMCWFEPAESAESLELREQYTEVYNAFFPEDTPLAGWDSVTIPRLGPTPLDVIGKPRVSPPGFTLDGLVLVKLGRQTG